LLRFSLALYARGRLKKKEKAYTLRFHGDNLKNLLARVNGHFVGKAKFNQIRHFELDKRCDIVMQPALKATSLKSAWYAGFMDTHGYIGLNKTSVIFNLSQKDPF
jgi:hypothetical protein